MTSSCELRSFSIAKSSSLCSTTSLEHVELVVLISSSDTKESLLQLRISESLLLLFIMEMTTCKNYGINTMFSCLNKWNIICY